MMWVNVGVNVEVGRRPKADRDSDGILRVVDVIYMVLQFSIACSMDFRSGFPSSDPHIQVGHICKNGTRDYECLCCSIRFSSPGLPAINSRSRKKYI